MKLPLNVKMPSITLPFGKGQTDDDTPDMDARPAESRLVLSGRTKVVAGTALAVFGIGFVMQNVIGPDSPVQQAAALKSPNVTVSKVEPTAADIAATPLTSSLATGLVTAKAPAPASDTAASDRIEVLADMPEEGLAPDALDALEPIQTAAYEPVNPNLPSEESVPQLACDMTLTATAAPAAMVDLSLDAPCLPNERLTLHHNGMMFTAVTNADGQHDMRVPALSQNAVYIVSFTNGEGAVTQIDVPTLEFYDRVVLQWRGDAGLGVHALEFGAEYFAQGHVFAEQLGDPANTARGEAGFMMRYGHDAGPEALMAEVYTFPTETSGKAGDVTLSVEAEVTGANCGAKVEAQTLQIRPGKALKSQDLELFVPDCDAVGDFLVLKNLLEDLKVASN